MKNIGILFAFLSAVFIGIGNVFGAEAAKYVNPITISMYSVLIASAILYPMTKFSVKKIQIKEMLKNYKKEILKITFSRVVIGGIVLFFGFKYTTAIKALFLLRLEPIFIILIGYIVLKEMISKKQLVLILILLFGAFLLSTAGDVSLFKEYQIGDLLVISSLALFAYSYIPAKKLSQKVNPINSAFITSILGGLILIPIALTLTPISSFYLSSHGIFLLLGYVLFLCLLGIVLWYKSLETVRPWVVGSILSIGTVIGSLFAYFWLGETLNIVQIIGAGIILISSFFISKEQ